MAGTGKVSMPIIYLLRNKGSFKIGLLILCTVCNTFEQVCNIGGLSGIIFVSFTGCSSFPEMLLKFRQFGVPVQGLLHLGPLLLHFHDSFLAHQFLSDS